MKICEKCGAHNSDDRIFCIDCSETLPEKLSAKEEQKLRSEISEQIEVMYNKKAPLYVSTFDKIMGVISALGAAATVVFLALCYFTEYTCTPLSLYALLFFVIAVLDAFVPRISWSLEKIRLGFTVNGADDLEPGDLYLSLRRCGIVAFTAFGFVSLFADIFAK